MWSSEKTRQIEPVSSPLDAAPGAPEPPRATRRDCAILTAILAVAAALRAVFLGKLSLGYDEIVQMIMARQRDPAGLMKILYQIEATRAPVHPLLLHYWLKVFGPSDSAGRSLSVLCGILTVGLVWAIGRQLYDRTTALWAMGLTAISPILIFYARETKMYAWLVMLTCLAWLLLFSFRASAPLWKQVCYAVCLVLLSYSYPLGLFMVIALGLAYLLNRRSFRLAWRSWLAIHLAWGLAFAPWLPRYMDHPPEILFPRSLKLFASCLIPFTGGNTLTTLLIVLPLVAWGVLRWGNLRAGLSTSEECEPPRRLERLPLDHPVAASSLLIWLVVPPALLFGYSLVRYPVFGAPRYVLFVAPAYLLLVARGLVKLPAWCRGVGALAMVLLAIPTAWSMVYAPGVKMDWRSAAREIRARDPQATVVVFSNAEKSPTLSRHPDVLCCHYYLGAPAHVVSGHALVMRLARDPRSLEPRLWFAFVGVSAGQSAPRLGRIERYYEPIATWQSPMLRLTYNRLKTHVEP